MAKIKTAELIGPALDWAVAKAEMGCDPEYFNGSVWITTGGFFARVRRIVYAPSTNWSQGDPIIEREEIAVWADSDGGWLASADEGSGMDYNGPAPLIAAMRCYVASKLGDEIEVPDELLS